MDPSEFNAGTAEEIARQFDAMVAAERWPGDPAPIDGDTLRAARLLALTMMTLVVLKLAFGPIALGCLLVVLAMVVRSEWTELTR